MNFDYNILKGYLYQILSENDLSLDFIIKYGKLGYGIYSPIYPELVKLSDKLSFNINHTSGLYPKDISNNIIYFAKSIFTEINQLNSEETNFSRLKLECFDNNIVELDVHWKHFSLSNSEQNVILLAFNISDISANNNLFDLNHNRNNNHNSLNKFDIDKALLNNTLILTDIFTIDELQELQDSFADATGIASLITQTNGTPITKPSNFCVLCRDIIRNTEVGRNNCHKSDAEMSSFNKKGPTIQKCKSAGIWDACVSIVINGNHIGNWLIGQIRTEDQDIDELIKYASIINVDINEYKKTLLTTKVMPYEQFEKISNLLYKFVNDITLKAYQNHILAKEYDLIKSKEREIADSESRLKLSLISSKSGMIDFHVKTNRIIANQEYSKILGYNYSDFTETVESWSKRLHVDDRERVNTFFENYLSGNKTDYNIEYRIQHSNGNWIWVQSQGSVVEYDENNKPNRLIGIIRDISDYKNVELQLKESEQRYKLMVENQNDFIVQVDNNNNLVYVSPSYCKLFGKKESDLLNKSFLPLIHPEDVEHTIQSMESLKKDPYTCYLEQRVMTVSGWRWLAWSDKAILNQHNTIDYVIGVGRDITEIKEAQIALQQKQVQTELLSGISSKFTEISNQDDLINYINVQLQSICNSELIIFSEYNPEKKVLITKDIITNQSFMKFAKGLLGDRISKFESPISDKAYIELTSKTININDSFSNVSGGTISSFVDNSFKAFTGLTKLYTISYVISGQLFGVSMIGMKSKQQEPPLEVLDSFANIAAVALKRMSIEQKFKTVSRGVEQTQALVVITDQNGVITYVNPSFCKVTGYSESEAIGSKPSILKSGNTKRSTYIDLWKTITSGHQWVGEFLNKKKNGELYWEAAIISPILNEKSAITNFIAVKQDITELKRITSDLIIAKEKAEENDKLKTAFLQNVSHEIRTPLNGIIGFTQLLKISDNEPNEVKLYSEAIERSGKRLISIVDNVIELSRIETGQSKIAISTVYPETILNMLHSQHFESANSKGLKILKNYPKLGEIFAFKTDERKFEIILDNIIGNAVKFTFKGSIEIGYLVSNEKIEFWVKDTGIGISDDILNKIFERFHQGETKLSRNYEGAGIGLALSKELVEMLGGEINLDSKVGIGSKFTFKLPLN